MITIVGTVGLAEGIIDDTCLVYLAFSQTSDNNKLRRGENIFSVSGT